MQGLLTQKIVHKKDFISALHRSHESFPSKEKRIGNAVPKQHGETIQGAASPAVGKDGGKITIVYLYRFAPPPPLRPLSLVLAA